MSSKGQYRSNSSKPALSAKAQQQEELRSPASESSPEPVRPAQETMDQSSESMAPTPSSSPNSDSQPTSASSEELQASAAAHPSSARAIAPHPLPIPPASEPMQYRAIGLVRAKYVPSAKQFTRGQLVTDDGCTFNAVLLGRVMSLVKKHLDPEASHLWVVYPRTREKTCDLHVQIVGVWEPETLDRDVNAPDLENGAASSEHSLDASTLDAETEDTSRSAEDGAIATAPDEPAAADADSRIAISPKPPMPPKPPAATASAPAIEYHPLPTPVEPEDGYFSIRGEIVSLAQNPNRVTVKIQQSPRKGEEEGRSFRLMLMGALEGRVIGHFWELNVRRQGIDLVIEDGQRICVVRPKKPAKGVKPVGGGKGKLPQRKPTGAPRPTPRPVPASASPPAAPSSEDSQTEVNASDTAE